MNSAHDFPKITINTNAEERLSFMREMFPNAIATSRNKCRGLYTYARNCNGPIVEIGTYFGSGTLALAAGLSRVNNDNLVYTVDPFKDCDGWIDGEHYYESNLVVFRKNALDSNLDNIALLRDTSKNAAKYFSVKYDLLFWDIMFDDYLDWYSHCALGGRMIFKDLATWEFGLQDILDHALLNGFVIDSSYTPGYLWTIRRVS